MRKQNLGLLAALGGLGGYLLLFFWTRLPSLEAVTGDVFRRGTLFLYLGEPQFLLYRWFGAPGEASILDRLPVLALAATILGVAFCLGWLLMKLIRADCRLTRLEVFVFSTAVGLNAISTYVLLVGLAGALGSVLVFALPAGAVLAAAGWLWGKKRRGGDRETGRRGDSETAKRQDRTKKVKKRKPSPPLPVSHSPPLSSRWLWLAAPLVLVILLGSMLPPTDFDVREYHLEVPKEFFQQGRIGFLAHNVYGNMAMGTEMLSLLGMVLAHNWWLGALVGKTVTGAFAPLAALGLLAAGKRLFSPAAGVVAAIIYLATPWIARVSTAGLVEGASACYLLLAVYAVVIWQEEEGTGKVESQESRVESQTAASPQPSTLNPQPCPAGRSRRAWLSSLSTLDSRLSTLLLAGYLAGGAVSTKYPAALFVLLPLAVWVLLARLRVGWGTACKRLAVFLAAAAVACGLWFGKNWVMAGNPTYPLLYEVFDSPQWSPEKNARWNHAHRPHDFSLHALAADTERVVLRSEWLSPIVMPLAALGLLSLFFLPGEFPGEKRRHRWLAAGLAIYVIYVIAAWWLLTHRIDRFWIPVLPLVALLAGHGALWSRSRIWRGAVVGLLVLATLFGFLVIASGAGSYNRYFVALARLRDSVERVGPWHAYLNLHARDGRVLLVGDAEPFDLEMPVAYNTVFDDPVFDRLVAGRSAEEVRRALADRRIRYVFVDWAEIARYRSPGNYGFSDFVQPKVFDELVAEHVLRPVPVPPELEASPGRLYEVAPVSP